jgi:hypothetical protein
MIFSGARMTERSPVEWQGTELDGAGSSISGIAFVIVGILFGLIAWRIRCMSRGWALGGLILTSLLILSDFVASPSPIAFIVHAVVFVYFVNAVRAAFAYERLVADQPISEILAEHPVIE